MVIFLCRHGERLDQVSSEWARTATEPWDPPITARGKKQIYNSVLQISKLGVESIVASPMRRTIESAEIASALLGIKFDIDVGLVEWQNPEWFEELTIGNIRHLNKTISTWSGQYRQTTLPIFPETEGQAQTRCTFAVQLLLKMNKKTLIIAHENGITGVVELLTKNKVKQVNYGEILQLCTIDGRFKLC